MRSRYWSCTKFADRLRGTPKLKYGTSEEWREWEKEAMTRHPFRYWLAEEALDAIQRTIHWPSDKLYDIKGYINNRWVSRAHSLTAHPRDIKPGNWCDVGNRFLPCLFNELVDFVEIELAWWHLAWDQDNRKNYNAPWWAFGWFRWRSWRCPEAGLDNLHWQAALRWTEDEVGADSPLLGKPTPQAERAKELIALYRWWTEVYPNRVDPHIASGWTEYCDRLREEYGTDGWVATESKNPETRKLGRKALKLVSKIEKQYEKENEEMLIRIVKARHALAT